MFGGPNDPSPPNANAHVGPHSLQVAPDGAVWSTLAFGNQLARFDPQREEFDIHPLEEGYYPHTLRFDGAGRIWYTVAGSNHVGRLDPATGEHGWIRLPTRSLGQDLAMRMLPVFVWMAQRFDFGDAASSGGGVTAPVPYGIDVAPDGGVWFSQLNANRIGRIDPMTLEVDMVDTPFSAPRRMRFDSQGRLWIPGFSSGLIARFDPATREFTEYALPTVQQDADEALARSEAKSFVEVTMNVVGRANWIANEEALSGDSAPHLECGSQGRGLGRPHGRNGAELCGHRA